MSIKETFRKFGGAVSNNSTTILTSLGVAGVLTTSVLTVRSTIKAYDIYYEAHEDTSEWETDPKEIIKMTWKAYIPPLTVGVMTIGAIIFAHRAHGRRNAALASMYTLSEKTMKLYQEKVVDQIGENKEQAIREEVSNDLRVVEHQEGDLNVYDTGKGKHLCYDVISGRYFKSDVETVRKAMNDMNHSLFSDMWGSLNEFYNYLGLPGIKIGDEMGWNVDTPLDIQISSTVTEQGEPCIVVDHEVLPTLDFRDW